MSAHNESHEKESQRDAFKSVGMESTIDKKESLSPEDQFLLWAQQRGMENCQTECESRIREEILSAACDCHGDSCCC